MSENIESIRLSEFFKFKSPTYLLGTTYTVSLMFLESAVWPHVDKSFLKRCLILCDKDGFRRATCEAVGLKDISTSYMAIPVPTERTFHPKFWIAINDEKVSFLVGSGNLTQSGFMDNNELFDVVSFDRGAAEPALIKDLKDFLSGLKGLFPSGNESAQWVGETIDQVSDLLVSGKEDDKAWSMRFLHSFSSAFPEQLATLSPGEGSELYVASPYFGASLDGLLLLREELSPSAIHVFPAVTSSGGINFDATLLEEKDSVDVSRLRLGRDGAWNHLKLYGIAHSSGDGLLFNGSVNCTFSAMSADNIEAGLARRVSASDVEMFFADREHLDSCEYEKLKFETDGEERWLVFFAINGGENLELQIVGKSSLISMPLEDVEITIRCGNEIDSIKIHQLFQGDSARQIIHWGRFKNISSTSGALYVELSGVDAKGEAVRGGNFVNDLNSLSSTPSHRNAFQAALKLASGDAIPTIFDISSLFAFLEESALKASSDKNEKPTNVNNEVSKDKPPKEQQKPIWPPQVAEKGDEQRFGSGDISVSWLQRILQLIFHAEMEDELTRENLDDCSGWSSSGDGSCFSRNHKAVSERAWTEVLRQFNKLVEGVHQCNRSSSFMPRIVPGLIAGSWILLGTRRKILSVGKVDQLEAVSLGTVENYLCIILGTVFESYGGKKSFIEVCNDEYGITLHKDFSRVFLVFFSYIYALGQKRTRQIFPLNQWSRFYAQCAEHFGAEQTNEQAIKRVYETFIASEGALPWPDVWQGVQELLNEDWQELPGMKGLKYLRSYDADLVGSEPDFVADVLGSDGLSGIRKLARRAEGLHFHQTASVERYCTGCGSRVKDRRFEKLAMMYPVLCMRCRKISVPEALITFEGNCNG